MKNNPMYVFGNAVCYVLTALQSNEIFEYISLGLSILTSIVIIFFKIYNGIVDAKKDGKITQDEVTKIIDDVSEDVKDLKDKVNK